MGPLRAWVATRALLVASPLLATSPAPSGQVPPSGTSPYLHRRSLDRVPWRLWDDAALDEAARGGRPIMLWLGAAGCGPCEEREAAAFGDPHVADVIASAFVPVVADADERPDLQDLLTVAASAPPEARKAAFLLQDGRPYLVEAVGTGEDGRAEVVALVLRAASRLRAEAARAESDAAALRDALSRAQTPAPTGGNTPSRLAVPPAAQAARVALAAGGPPSRARLGAALFLLELSEPRETVADIALARQALEAARAEEPPPTAVGRLAHDALLLRGLALVAGEADIRTRAAAESIAQRMLSSRDAAGRVTPGAGDGRVFAGASGLAVGALAVAGRRLGRGELASAAEEIAGATLKVVGPASALRRAVRDGRASGPGFLDDYAYLAAGLLDLHEATGNERWPREAEALASAALAAHLDPLTGGLFLAPASAAPFGMRVRTGYDGPLPSPVGVLASVLLRLEAATGQTRYRAVARGIVQAFASDLERAPGGLFALASAAARLDAPAAAVPERGQAGPVSRPAFSAEVHAIPTAAPGAVVAVVVTLRIAPGWAIVARGPANGLLPLSASVAGPDLAAAGAPSYPVPTADGMLRGDVRVVLPVRVAAAARAGSRAARVRLRVQPCREGGDCEPPESCVLDAPLEIGGRGR